jgi:hypothetical protein
MAPTNTPNKNPMKIRNLAISAIARNIIPPVTGPKQKLKRQIVKDTVRDVWGRGSGQHIVEKLGTIVSFF